MKEMLRQFRIFYRILQPKFFYSTDIVIGENQLTERLSSEFGNIKLIKFALKNNDLQSIHFDEWKSRIDVLKHYHFGNGHCFEMVAQYPGLLKIPLDKLGKALEEWLYTDLGVSNFHQILLKEPQFLEIGGEQIKKRIPYLRALCRSPSGVVEILIRSPNVMFDDWDSVLSKIDYLMKEKKFNIGEIMQSSALSNTLDFIQFRLELLEKCGIYKQDNTPVHKKNEYDISMHKNPHLKFILVANPKLFVKTAKISLEEYFMCSNMYKENEDTVDDMEDLKSSYNK